MTAGAAIVAADDGTEFAPEPETENAAGFLEWIVETPVGVGTDSTSEAALR